MSQQTTHTGNMTILPTNNTEVTLPLPFPTINPNMPTTAALQYRAVTGDQINNQTFDLPYYQQVQHLLDFATPPPSDFEHNLAQISAFVDNWLFQKHPKDRVSGRKHDLTPHQKYRTMYALCVLYTTQKPQQHTLTEFYENVQLLVSFEAAEKQLHFILATSPIPHSRILTIYSEFNNQAAVK